MKHPDMKVIQTEDGSHSLYRADINETYHSFHGARGESLHVFIAHGLKTLPHPTLRIFEVGMGTGLNVFLSALFATGYQRSVEMVTIEPIPVKKEIYTQLNFGQTDSESKLLNSIHEGPWEDSYLLQPNFSLLKKNCTLEAFQWEEKGFDIIYFDAFAPSKQPEVWSMDNLQKCFDLLNPLGILTTYCAQGQFKRNLKTIGFEVESLPGAMGKKEMVRAFKP